MRWPEKPTCHGENPNGFPQPVWRDADPDRRDTCECGYERVGPYGYPFRTCRYCGSIHLGDFADWCAKAPVTLGGTDWKYGWPHKFYVEGIPNPLVGQSVDSTSTGWWVDHEPAASDLEEARSHLTGEIVVNVYAAENKRTGGYGWQICAHSRTPAPQESHAKLYAEHLLD